MDIRTFYQYGSFAVSPAMAKRLSGSSSQCIIATVDANKAYFDGAKACKVTLPQDIPARNFWSFTVYDNQTRSMLDTPQRFPRAGSQSYPTPAAEQNRDGTPTLCFSPEQPDGVARSNWIQTIRAEAGTCSCAFTVRWNRSLTRLGDRAR